MNWDGKRTGKNNWANIYAAIKTAPPGSPLHIAQDPKDWVWGTPYYSELVNIVDLLRVGNLQRGGDESGLKKFEPRRRPGEQNDDNGEMITSAPMPISEFNQIFGW